MAELTADTKAADVVEHVRAALAAATVGGERLFTAVAVYDDVASFVRTLGASLSGTVCGVVARPPERGDGQDDADAYTERVRMDVCVGFAFVRAAGASEQAAVAESGRLAGLVRKALLLDPSRGGRCETIQWNGSGPVMAGTDCTGAFSPLQQKPNQAFYVATIPAACGWTG